MRIVNLESPEPTDKEIEEFWSIAGLPTLVSADGKYITMYVSFELDEDGECSLIIESVCPRYPDKEAFTEHSWLEYELNQNGSDSFDLSASWLLEEGVAPGQLVLVEFYGNYFKSWTECGYEYDSEHHIDVLWKEPKSPLELADLWSVWLDSYASTTGECLAVDCSYRIGTKTTCSAAKYCSYQLPREWTTLRHSKNLEEGNDVKEEDKTRSTRW